MNDLQLILQPTITLSYSLSHKLLVSVLAVIIISLLSFANANELTTSISTQSTYSGVSQSEIQNILVEAEAPDALWVAVGDNEFGVYEPDSSDLIAYVAQYGSQKIVINTVDHIIASGTGQAGDSKYAELLTEKHTDFDEPEAALSQLNRVSALPDNPDMSAIYVAEADSAKRAARASVAVASPSSIWLLLFAPIVAPRLRQL